MEKWLNILNSLQYHFANYTYTHTNIVGLTWPIQTGQGSDICQSSVVWTFVIGKCQPITNDHTNQPITNDDTTLDTRAKFARNRKEITLRHASQAPRDVTGSRAEHWEIATVKRRPVRHWSTDLSKSDSWMKENWDMTWNILEAILIDPNPILRVSPMLRPWYVDVTSTSWSSYAYINLESTLCHGSQTGESPPRGGHACPHLRGHEMTTAGSCFCRPRLCALLPVSNVYEG